MQNRQDLGHSSKLYLQVQTGFLEVQLQQLLLEARRYPLGHFQRQQALTAMIRLIAQSKKLWQENTPYYADALQQTWLYFCQNICEGTTGECYDPARGSITTWLNRYLRWRLQDLCVQERQRQQRALSGWSQGQYRWHWIDSLAANPDIPPILQETQNWALADSTGELRRIHVRHRPDVTAQILILKRLPPEMQWESLAQEFGLSVSTLSSFYQRQCIPVLRKFGRTQGYL
jgi:hypothetical protein